MKKENEIIVYQPDSSFRLEVRIEDETVWLNRNQIAILFDRDVKTIGKHINNALKEELQGLPTVAKFATVQKEGDRMITRNLEYYNLDVIVSVGYRVKSQRGVLFRIWANKVLKDYLLKGYSINQRFIELENRIDHRLYQQQRQIDDIADKVDFVINSSLKPKEGILFDGQIWDAHNFATNLIRSAQERVVLIDNYIDNTVLTQLDNRNNGVAATIYTGKMTPQLKQDVERHNRQYPSIEVKSVSAVHDRFLIIDKELYHIGASLKDLGKNLFAFVKMETTPDYLLDSLKVSGF